MGGKKENFVLIGAGLPRTGTLSTRTALVELLGGSCYHMSTVMNERPDHHNHWRKAASGEVSIGEWQTVLADYRSGVDYPISFFYKEILEAYPNAKVLLNVRDPTKWYLSVKNAIYKMHCTASQFPCSWLLSLVGKFDSVNLVGTLSDIVPKGSSTGLGMFGAVGAGEETAIKFWYDHINEVKAHVPADQLLVFEVKDGWAPLCKFLGVPVPDQPFPRVNDTHEIEMFRQQLVMWSWLVIVLLPFLLLLAVLYLGPTSYEPVLFIVFMGVGLLAYLKKTMVSKLLNHGKKKEE